MYHSIEDVDFHDAIISEIIIASNPDFMDTLTLNITLCSQQKIAVTFVNCFAIGLDLSMWITGNDSIRTWCFTPTQKQESAVNRFAEKGFAAVKGKFHFVSFQMNITNSCLEISYEKVFVNGVGIDIAVSL